MLTSERQMTFDRVYRKIIDDENFSRWLNELLESVPAAIRDTAWVSAHYDEDDGVTLTVMNSRDETDDEMAARLKQDEGIEDRRRRNTFAALKAKYAAEFDSLDPMSYEEVRQA